MTDQKPSDDLTERALGSLDELAHIWAAEVGLSIMASNVSGSQEGVYALALQAFIEGAYRGRTSHGDAVERLIRIADLVYHDYRKEAWEEAHAYFTTEHEKS